MTTGEVMYIVYKLITGDTASVTCTLIVNIISDWECYDLSSCYVTDHTDECNVLPLVVWEKI